MLDDARMFFRFAAGLRRFLNTPLSPADCRRIVEESIRNRGASFLRLMERAVFGFPASPYLALMKWAGLEYGDLRNMVAADGLETTLERLFDAGVSVTLDEFKGRRPIERAGFKLAVKEGDFDNPLLVREFEVATGGSTGPRRRLAIDFDLLLVDAAYKWVFHHACGVEDRPFAQWKAVPPGSAGLKSMFWAAKVGNPMRRWFTPLPVSWKWQDLRSALFMACALHVSRLCGRPIRAPEHVPLEENWRIADWVAEMVRAGEPPLLYVSAGRAVRVATSAMERGLDISGSVFKVGGEPFTPAKAQLLKEAGVRYLGGYAMSECGPLGGGCASPLFPDEAHLFSGKVAVFQRPKALSGGQSSVDALYLTTLLTSTPKIMLNLESGDCGVLSRRSCGCGLEQIGCDLHLHNIRSYDKLTTGGMHFLGADFLSLVEEVLPRTFGGRPTDYQFVERDRGADTRVSVVISPRVGPVDEAGVIRTVIEFLAARDRGDRAMAAQWRDGNVLRTVREEPHMTGAGKIPALWIRRD